MRHPVPDIVVATLVDSVLQKSLKPEWEEAERVREESAEFLPGHGFSGDLSFALSMVASELVENALKIWRLSPAGARHLDGNRGGDHRRHHRGAQPDRPVERTLPAAGPHHPVDPGLPESVRGVRRAPQGGLRVFARGGGERAWAGPRRLRSAGDTRLLHRRIRHAGALGGLSKVWACPGSVDSNGLSYMSRVKVSSRAHYRRSGVR